MSPEFNYRAKTVEGKTVKGKLVADSVQEVAELINKKDQYVLNIEENKDIDLNKVMRLFRSVKPGELAILSRQFAVLIETGIPIVHCLDILINQIDNKYFKKVMQMVYQEVEVGNSFSQALSKHDDIFPPIYAKMVNAGEQGGILDKVMNWLADYYDQEDELRSKVKSAVMYPVVVLMVAFGIIIFLMSVVVPTFAQLFSSMGGQLPLPTRIVMGISDIIIGYWYLILLFGLILFSGIGAYLKSPSGRYNIDRLKLKIPIMGKVFIKVEIARLTRTLGNLLKSGVSLMEALKISEEIVDNQVIARQLRQARFKVREGVPLSQPLKESGVFPRLMIQMLVVGEETGTLSKMLGKITDFYDKDVENQLEGVMSILEPVLIVLIAILIGSIVISIILPMFDMVNLI